MVLAKSLGGAAESRIQAEGGKHCALGDWAGVRASRAQKAEGAMARDVAIGARLRSHWTPKIENESHTKWDQYFLFFFLYKFIF